jgi:peptide/nickel transport system permease protein
MNKPPPDSSEPSTNNWREPARLLLREPRSIVGLILVVGLVFVSLLSPVIAPHDYKSMFEGHEAAGPSLRFLMGTDKEGRDILSRLLSGTRVSLIVGVGATILSVFIGVAVGLLAGYFGGWVDATLMRITDTFYAFPSVLLAVTMAAVVDKPTLAHICLVLGLVGWTGIARIVRGQVLSEKSRDYVRAAVALGAGHLRVMVVHILPNCVGVIVVVATLAVGSNILIEASLSFLGLGSDSLGISWGRMLTDSQQYLTSHPWSSVWPGLAIVLTVLGFNLLGDSLRDVLDPRTRRELGG